MTSTRDKLEEYRRRKQLEEARDTRRQFLWDVVTLQPVRRRLARHDADAADGDGDVDGDQGGEGSEGVEEEESEKDRQWTKIDWAILLVKLLVWICMQVCYEMWYVTGWMVRMCCRLFS